MVKPFLSQNPNYYYFFSPTYILTHQRYGLGGVVGWSLKSTEGYLFGLQEAHKTSFSFLFIYLFILIASLNLYALKL